MVGNTKPLQTLDYRTEDLENMNLIQARGGVTASLISSDKLGACRLLAAKFQCGLYYTLQELSHF